jgi:hypothetical protein
MEHAHDTGDHDHFLVRNVEPKIEGLDHFPSDFLAGSRGKVGERFQKGLVLISVE